MNDLIHIQYLKILTISNQVKMLINKLVIFALIFVASLQKCQNSSQFRYELVEPSQLINYNAICFEYSKRTCCSATNFENVAKKIVKVLGATYELSHPCRRKITNLMCSSCDADVGQNIRDGVCGAYCNHLYEVCKNDYFSIDSTNQLKVCRQDDIICSTLSDIVANRSQSYVCQLFDQKISNRECWNGQISSRFKGKGKKKITFSQRTTAKKAQSKKASSWLPELSSQVKVYLSLVFVLILAFFYQYYMPKYRNWKRQIRNI